jgi:putative transposase
MARDNRLWGAERIRGEFLKLGIRVCKRTIQQYMRHVRSPRRGGQNWATFLQNHAKDMWACDFLQVTDLFFRSLFAFFILDMYSRRVIHVGVTRTPTDAWTAQQLREAPSYGQSPSYLIRDRDGKFGSCFARVAATSDIHMLKTPYHAPRANAICERFLGSVRRECLDHLFILQEKQLHRVLRAYVQYYNQARPQEAHQTTDPRTVWCACPSGSRGWQNPLLPSPGWIAPRLPQKRLISDMCTKKRMVSLGGARFMGEVAYSQSFLPFFSDECNQQVVCVYP